MFVIHNNYDLDNLEDSFVVFGHHNLNNYSEIMGDN